MNFAETLQRLPAITHLAALHLIDPQGQLVASIDNLPGKAGSLAVYHALAAQYGCINAQAAQHGLTLFAEHTASARQHRGSHPNIDRLFDIIDGAPELTVRLIPR